MSAVIKCDFSSVVEVWNRFALTEDLLLISLFIFEVLQTCCFIPDKGICVVGGIRQ